MNTQDISILAAALIANLQPTNVRAIYDQEGLDFTDDDGPGVTFEIGETGDYTVVRVTTPARDRGPGYDGTVNVKYNITTYTGEGEIAWWNFNIEMQKGT